MQFRSDLAKSPSDSRFFALFKPIGNSSWFYVCVPLVPVVSPATMASAQRKKKSLLKIVILGDSGYDLLSMA